MPLVAVKHGDHHHADHPVRAIRLYPFARFWQPDSGFAFLLLGLSLMGLTFGPMGALLPELFPTEVRYTGASFSYNVSSILRASVAPYIAAWLQTNYGLGAVGLYLAAMAGLTLIALLLTHETRHQSL